MTTPPLFPRRMDVFRTWGRVFPVKPRARDGSMRSCDRLLDGLGFSFFSPGPTPAVRPLSLATQVRSMLVGSTGRSSMAPWQTAQ